MVKLEDAVIARFSSHGMNFEILVDPNLAVSLREGKQVDMRAMLAIDKVFKDARKGESASEESLLKVFGTSDVFRVAEQIVKNGEIQLTTEQRRKMREEKVKQIVTILSRRAINPQTGTPHPPARIEAALKEAKVQIDEFKSAEEQIPKIVKALLPILPLKFEIRKIAVKIPPAYVGKAIHVVRKMGTIKQEEWLQDGSWVVLMEIPAAVEAEVYEKLNELTKGEVETKVIE
ncbi:MAG: ribosome assembly factor SBDS [Candidatus Hadarchaeales archaeon]